MALPRSDIQQDDEFPEALSVWLEAINENNNQQAYLAASEFIDYILGEEVAPEASISSEGSIPKLTEFTLGEEVTSEAELTDPSGEEESISSESSCSDLTTNLTPSTSEEIFQKLSADIKLHLPNNSKKFSILNKLLNLITNGEKARNADLRKFSELMSTLNIGLRNALIKLILLKERFDFFSKNTEMYLHKYLIENKNSLADIFPIIWSVYTADHTHPYLNNTNASRLINLIIKPIANYLSELPLAQVVPYLISIAKKRRYALFGTNLKEKIAKAIEEKDPEIKVFVEKIIQWKNTNFMQLYRKELDNYVKNSDSLELKKSYDAAYGLEWDDQPTEQRIKRKRMGADDSIQTSTMPFSFLNDLGTRQPSSQSVSSQDITHQPHKI